MKKQHPVVAETLALLLGEILVSALVVLVYFALSVGVESLSGIFTYKVFTGVLLGTLVTVGNFFFLALATDRAFSNALAARGEGQMSDEEAAAFATEYQTKMRASMFVSQIVRTVVMLAALVLGFVLPWFEGIATLVPLLAYRPVLMVREFFRKKEK